MASVRKEIHIDVPPEVAWAALGDFGALHQRLVPGFAVDCRLEGRDRIVTFFNGSVLRERLVDRDETGRRLVWSIVDGPYEHHNGSAQVFPSEGGGTLLVWISDVLPDEAAESTGAMMAKGIGILKQTLESDPSI